MLYRILTEDVNRDRVVALVSGRFKGFALIPAQGYWMGKPEAALTIEVDSELSDDEEQVYQLAREIRDLNHQEAVLVQKVRTESKLV